MSNLGISDFYKTATTFGFARSNLYRLENITNDIYTPDDTGNLYLYLQGGTIPSRQIATTAVVHKSFSYNVPTVASYPENIGWSVDFSCDRDYKLRNIFEKWSVETFDEHTSLTSSLGKWWDCDVVISLLDNFTSAEAKNVGAERTPVSRENMQVIRKYTLKGVFPVQIGAMSYSTAGGGNIVKMPVTLGFQYIVSEDLAQS